MVAILVREEVRGNRFWVRSRVLILLGLLAGRKVAKLRNNQVDRLVRRGRFTVVEPQVDANIFVSRLVHAVTGIGPSGNNRLFRNVRRFVDAEYELRQPPNPI